MVIIGQSVALRRAAAALLVMTTLCSPSGIANAAGVDGVVVKKNDEGDNVILLQMRLRDLGYYNYKITGFCGDFTVTAIKSFQKENGITSDGVAGQQTLDQLYANSAKRKPIEPLVKPAETKKASVKYGAYRDWFDYVNSRWKYGAKCKVIDFNTGTSYYMQRVGGHNHVDAAPPNKTETAKFKKTYGNQWSWGRRAVVVIIGGERIAASTNGYPHGSTGIKGNGMVDLVDGSVGQICIHFKNSRTHEHNMRDPEHQYQVKRAAGLVK